MADIAASDVAYTMMTQRTLGDSRKSNRVKLVFGNGSLTYPVGGIPLTKAKLGCPAVIESMNIVDDGTSAYSFCYDQSAAKLLVYKDSFTVTKGAITASTELGLSADAASATVNNNTIAATRTLLSASPVSKAEATAIAIAAQTIEVEVIGW